MKFESTWNSVREHKVPKWFQDAKFGIYTHWGIYSVPAFGPNGSWYPYNMYREETPQYEYHIRNYGHPSKFGYKDFIPMFTGERFDPDKWADLFKNAGAKFAGPVGEHHDGFSMWNSRVNDWNAARMGPKKDVVGELEKSIKSQNMKFIVALHHAENWWFFPHWEKEYDTADPMYSGLYGPLHNLDLAEKMPEIKGKGLKYEQWPLQDKPTKEFLDKWLAKIYEVIDNYQPDMLWFDNGIDFIQEHYRREFLAYYYNMGKEWGKEVVVTYKSHELVPGSAVVDLELGRFNELTYHTWITDTTVDDGHGWGYLKNTKYKTATELIHYLIDNVSKNGLLLLNVGPKPNGEIPEEAVDILLEIGKWLKMNGEAIYGTTPWLTYGEGPHNITKSGEFNEDEKIRYTGEDIRFTSKDNNLYAICLGWPGKELTIKIVAEKFYESEIKSIKMLGVDKTLSWKMTKEDLKIQTPEKRPCDHAYVFKIERKHPF
ncbi:alpha-L-fucosidase [Athalassotoga sp.]|uniref:alpha-L-fucosidase n=1 Tax=Athalassotoga sp. TaxID=2022597 RepID=UPI003D0690A6